MITKRYVVKRYFTKLSSPETYKFYCKYEALDFFNQSCLECQKAIIIDGSRGGRIIDSFRL